VVRFLEQATLGTDGALVAEVKAKGSRSSSTSSFR
jgi:hypothetical protein